MLSVAVATLVFLFTVTLRAWGISSRFLLLGDQMRDWSIALLPFHDLPLVGPPTHVHGYTIGPAFYWIMWAIRVTLGPWFDNLPHAGGIGQAALQSGADVLLVFAIWRRIGSLPIALLTVIVAATSPFDLSLSALVWNPVMGSTLAKMALALVLMDWHRRSSARMAILTAIAWSAVHAYTGTIFVTVSVFAVALVDPFVRGERHIASRNVVAIAVVVALLQVPYLLHRITHRNEDAAMGAVTGGLAQILTGSTSPEFAKSEAGYVEAVYRILIWPWQFAWTGWALIIASLIVVLRYRRDTVVLTMTLLPALTAIVGYALFLGALDSYYYLSLMAPAALAVALALTALPSRRLADLIAIALLSVVLVNVPARRQHAMTLNQMPQYGAIVEASRVMARRGVPMRSIETEFRLEPTNDPGYIYELLGGHIDRTSPWVAVIAENGQVTYRQVEPR